MTLTERVKDKAKALGFDLAGIAEASPPARDGARLAAWLAADKHASMAWMAKDAPKRADPAQILPGCTSVIALGAS